MKIVRNQVDIRLVVSILFFDKKVLRQLNYVAHRKINNSLLSVEM